MAGWTYVGENPQDLVADLAEKWHGLPSYGGRDPSNPAFGATQFYVESGGCRICIAQAGHSRYYLNDTLSLESISFVAVGDLGGVLWD